MGNAIENARAKLKSALSRLCTAIQACSDEIDNYDAKIADLKEQNVYLSAEVDTLLKLHNKIISNQAYKSDSTIQPANDASNNKELFPEGTNNTPSESVRLALSKLKREVKKNSKGEA